MLAEVISFEEQSEKKRKMCNYKGILYPVEREKELSKIKIVEDGHTITKRTHRYYIVVDREKLYLDFDGNKVCNKQPGNSSTVEFLTIEEVERVKQTLKENIANAATPTNQLIAWRNYALFYCGINVGIRASDLRRLQWKHLYDKDGNRLEGWWFESKKTGDPTMIDFNGSFFNMVEVYREKLIELKGIPHKEDYLFFSKKNDKEAIDAKQMWRILDSIAKQAGIAKNVGSHSLRKTFGRNAYENSTDKEDALVILADWFTHDNISDTRKYVGITREKKKGLVKSIDGIFGDI